MFTGIIQGTAKVIKIEKREAFQQHTIEMPERLLKGLELGASVAHNGCCLTTTKIDGSFVSFDLMQETLRITNLGLLEVDDSINVERAACFGDEIGGHAMSGHIICTAEVTEIIASGDNCQIWFELPTQHQKYLFNKGYIGIDGISLTIGEVDNNQFCVNLIPETLNRTNIGNRQLGDSINIEIDPQTQAIVETVERLLQNKEKMTES
jgi:riboflavin synthase